MGRSLRGRHGMLVQSSVTVRPMASGGLVSRLGAAEMGGSPVVGSIMGRLWEGGQLGLRI